MINEMLWINKKLSTEHESLKLTECQFLGVPSKPVRLFISVAQLM